MIWGFGNRRKLNSAETQLIGKDPDAGKDWGQEEKGMTEDEMLGWHHWLDGHEFEQIPGDSEGQESLVCCSPWGCKELDMPYNWTTTLLRQMQKLMEKDWRLLREVGPGDEAISSMFTNCCLKKLGSHTSTETRR